MAKKGCTAWNKGLIKGPDYLVDNKTGCWEWQKSKNNQGYGRKTMGEGVSKKTVVAHKYYYEQKKGVVPIGMDLHHKCCNEGCVNPSHLKLMTRLEHRRLTSKLNKKIVIEILSSKLRASEAAIFFKVSKGTIERIRSGKSWKDIGDKYIKKLPIPNKDKTHCKYGHEFSKENTRPYKSKRQKIGRVCLECKKRLGREYYQRKKNLNKNLLNYATGNN